jgi:hypothetical protein
LDVEQSASLEARLGICPEHPGYYGGTTHFSAKLRLHDKGFGWELEPPERSSSNRMRRRWLSESIITVKFEGWRSPEQSLELFKRPLVKYGLVYRALRRKPRENAVYYVQTNEIFRGGAVHIDPASRMPSYNALLERLNPPALNSDQVVPMRPTNLSSSDMCLHSQTPNTLRAWIYCSLTACLFSAS